ncbi:Chromo shadow domain,Chromo/chromo shadow domain,Chromo domain,Chromo domain-like [Cinara cedri]|uniref:Chromo shadow domain,Chromo/chromo shadow domain,Chromo domain,Chromo domain-like n=1 Tax=Cinara cedri TaxID=506608 RepID=A0A5E4NSV2_9HEMI|nr:Chromo shadow domain,Chromo/chromo shadow domain,Chromo domain,Chromo domain-like [Cinara cedri]
MEHVLLPYRGTEFISSTTTHNPEEQFFVEKILKKNVIGNYVYYFIKWKNYDDDENTWELGKNLHCMEIINEYEENLKSQEQPKRVDNVDIDNNIADEEDDVNEADDINEEPDDVNEADDINEEPDDVNEADDANEEPDDVNEADDINEEADDINEEADDINEEADDNNEESDDFSEDSDDIDEEADDDDEYEDVEEEEEEEVEEIKSDEDDVLIEYNGYCKHDMIEIVGTTFIDDELTFLIKLRNDTIILFPANVANKLCPQMVIRFYEPNFIYNHPKFRNRHR